MCQEFMRSQSAMSANKLPFSFFLIYCSLQEACR